MNKMLRPVLAFSLITLETFALGGCASDSVITAPVQSTVHTLKIGDSFMFSDSTFDESGVLVEGSDSSVILRTISTGGSYSGRDSVATLASAADTIRFQQLPGEGFASFQEPIAITDDIVFSGVWVDHRLADSARTITVKNSHLDGTINGAPTSVALTITSGFLRDTSMSINGVIARTHLFTKVVTVKVSIPIYSVLSTTTVSVTYAYAPTFGFHAYQQSVTHSDSPGSPIPNGKTTSLLTRVNE
jgi:hypothetical protein